MVRKGSGRKREGIEEEEEAGGYSFRFNRAMHYSAKRGIAIACRPSVRPSVCL